jgi:predicted aconitase
MTDLTTAEQDMLDGGQGRGSALAMHIVLAAARCQGAAQLREVSSAHVDSCLYHGQSSLDFVAAIAQDSAQVRVRTTLNVGSLDLHRPRLFRGPAEFAEQARRLTTAYVSLGCLPTFTCAPYQLPGRPGYGEHVAWAESNAIAFGNSVLGVRTERNGDFLDISAAITGRVPDAGLHLEVNRAATAVFDVAADVWGKFDRTLLPALLGHTIGRATGDRVPAVVGLAGQVIDEDWMKAFGAAAASSGSVALFHLVGITPDAADLNTALHDRPPAIRRSVSSDDLTIARSQLTTATTSMPLGAVSLGTPHLSRAQLRLIADKTQGSTVRVPTYACTSRACLAAEPAAAQVLHASGIQLVTDTCTYVTPIIEPTGVVLTDSAKWAYYAPANLGHTVMLASLEECLASALAGSYQLEHR